MRRLARWLLALCPAVSLIICAAASALWVRGYRVADVAYLHARGTTDHYMVASSRGRLGVIVTPFPPDRVAAGVRFARARRAPGPLLKRGGYFRNYVNHFGIEAAWTPNRPGRAVSMPTWWLVVLTAPPSAIWLRNRVRRIARRARGQCLSCGYDLRASPERCPECGATRTSNQLPAPHLRP